MAGIYLPGREMPRSCYFCDFIFRDTADKKVYCTESGCHKEAWLDLSDTLANSRHEDCPLVFVPDHGRLGDLDELFKRMFIGPDGQRYPDKDVDGWDHTYTFRGIKHEILSAPTIIPGEKETQP